MELIETAVVRLPVDLSASSMPQLIRDFEAALASPAPLVVVVGADAGTFCLGLAVGSGTRDQAPTHAFAGLLATLHRAPKPLLGVVDGRAIGGGMGLACACDWVLATERATFGLPELLWGLLPAIIYPVLADRMAPHAVRQWIISAHTRTAIEAQAAGLVDELIPASAVDRSIERAARHLRRLEPHALQQLRRWARESRQADLVSALNTGAGLTGIMLRDPDVKRRWDAFTAGEAPW